MDQRDCSSIGLPGSGAVTVMSLSAKSTTRISTVATATTVVVALSAGVLSWHGLTQLGLGAGLGQLSVLLPVVIDGGMLVGALHVLQAGLSGRSTAWGWLMTWAGIVVSVWGNVAGAQSLTFASAIVHAMPALTLAATIEATMQIIKHRALHHLDGESVMTPVVEAPEPAKLPESPATAAVLEDDSMPVAQEDEPATSKAGVEDVPVKAEREMPIHPNGEVFETDVQPVGFVPTLLKAPAPRISARELAFGVWMYGEQEAGRTFSAKLAVESGVASSDSTARRLHKKVVDMGLEMFAEHYRQHTSESRGA